MDVTQTYCENHFAMSRISNHYVVHLKLTQFYMSVRSQYIWGKSSINRRNANVTPHFCNCAQHTSVLSRWIQTRAPGVGCPEGPTSQVTGDHLGLRLKEKKQMFIQLT